MPNLSWKTIAGVALIGLGHVIATVFPVWFPAGIPWDVVGNWIVGVGITLAGIGARMALEKGFTSLKK